MLIKNILLIRQNNISFNVLLYLSIALFLGDKFALSVSSHPMLFVLQLCSTICAAAINRSRKGSRHTSASTVLYALSLDSPCHSLTRLTLSLFLQLFEITVPITQGTKPVTISVANHTQCSCLSKLDVYKQVHSIIRRALPE